MDLRTAIRDGYLRLTLEGRSTLEGSVDLLRPAVDACREAGVSAVLVDVRALEGEATVTDRYYLGSAIASVIGRWSGPLVKLISTGTPWMRESDGFSRTSPFASTIIPCQKSLTYSESYTWAL